MKAVIGLGNPGIKHHYSRHNVGFRLLDKLVKEIGFRYKDGFRGKVADGVLNGERVVFLKPFTYMNLSGLSVRELVHYYRIEKEDFLIVHDDLDLPLGKLRLRSKGSSGGHNGLKSIIGELGYEDFWRLKIGVGRPQEKWEVIDYVLSAFKREEEKILAEVLSKACEAATLWLEGKNIEAMNRYN
ncbi:MAG: aminoacyl-tRNA hydrolase [Desulfitobacteriia bacterium]|jgi:PTH1 family peptidyl-tRNA hydrolase